ncbi:MAG: hypothetical protein EOP01_07190, partial [Propionibacteriaceae bacterium]
TGALYAWELERGRRSWRVPVRGGVVTNDGSVMKSLAESGAGLTYAFEPEVREQLRSGTLVRSMLADGLVDELHLFVYPVGLGEGPYLFPQGGPRATLALLGSTAYENGVVHLTYGAAPSPVEGPQAD